MVDAVANQALVAKMVDADRLVVEAIPVTLRLPRVAPPAERLVVEAFVRYAVPVAEKLVVDAFTKYAFVA